VSPQPSASSKPVAPARPGRRPSPPKVLSLSEFLTYSPESTSTPKKNDQSAGGENP
jgi:hypothetical protein